MGSLGRRYRTWNNRRKFASVGKRCRVGGKDMIVEGNVEIGDYVRLRDHTILRTEEKGRITIGDRSGLSYFAIIEAREHVEIGKATALTEFVVVRDTSHLVYGTKAHFYFTPYIVKPVKIGDEVFIGSRTYIHPGVTVGNGAVIGVGSVLTEDTEVGEYEIWAGAPAKKIAHRVDGVPPEKIAEAERLIAEQGMRQDRYGVAKTQPD